MALTLTEDNDHQPYVPESAVVIELENEEEAAEVVTVSEVVNLSETFGVKNA